MDKKKSIWGRTYNYFDKFEDKIRGYLSHRPILYTFIGGVAIVLFWRGIWHTADMFPWLTGPMSILISVVILLATGLFVSSFVGDMIIISGLNKDKKTTEKNEAELQQEMQKEEHVIDRLEQKIDTLTDKIEELEEKVEDKTV